MNVYEATLERLNIIFSEFDNIYVSFSGGKDSGVLLNLCIDYIRKYKLKRKIGVFYIDYESQYQMTTDYVNEILESNQDILEVYKICMPVKVACATSMHQTYWIPWEKDKNQFWVRKISHDSINEDNHNFDFWYDGMWDYDFQKQFPHWLHQQKKAQKTICLVGIRTQESLNRWRAIYANKNYNTYEDLKWTSKISDNIYNAYPIYEWKTEDIWVANSRFKWSYNKIYDIYFKAGLDIEQMRVVSPFIGTALNSLKLYKAIEPNTWAKMIGRVNGVNFSAIYGGTTAMGWKNITLPEGYTWEKYMHFLLSTLPEDIKNNYLKKLNISIKFWKEKGGVLSNDIIRKLQTTGIEFEIGSTNYKTSKLPIRMEYLDDIDITEFKEIPTYKRMCICIMKNDHLCKYMGFSLTKKEIEIRKNVMDKYKEIV